MCPGKTIRGSEAEEGNEGHQRALLQYDAMTRQAVHWIGYSDFCIKSNTTLL